ncbi:MAG: RNA 2'-phosphotransferase [Syntrophobacteraceae bacterium]
MLKDKPGTLAKTLDFIGRHSPAEFGLFWDPDATMPWKEFYWALQEDSSLRFVRESTIRELTLVGVELPFILDANLLRLRPEVGWHGYPVATEVPRRLYFGLKPRQLASAMEQGIRAARRSYVALCQDRELAVRIAKRTEQSPIVVEILAEEALRSGLRFFFAGLQLYLVESVATKFINFPTLRREKAEKLAAPVKKSKPAPPPCPAGSFIVEAHHLVLGGSSKAGSKGSNRESKGGWKRSGRTERHKRDV